MSEVLEEQQSESPDIARFVGIVRRRHLQFLLPLLAGWLLVWGSSWILPPRYKSTTNILVQQPTLSENYVVPNISDEMQARLENTTQQILSTAHLLAIIDKFHLYGAPTKAATGDEMVEHMRKDMTLDLVRDPQKQEISGFKISYVAKDPHLAQQVTSELTNLFINENSRAGLEASKGTTSFIEKQLSDARADLAVEEQKVRAYEATHQGALPAEAASNLQILSGLQSQLQNEEDALGTAKQNRVYLETMISQERASQIKTGGGGAAGSAELASVNDQLDKMKAQLADLSSRYTDNYPDVKSLKTQIARAEAQREALIAAASRKSADPKQQSDSALGDSPSSATLRQLQGQLQSNQLEIANRTASVADLKNRVGQYEGRLNSSAGTEQQLTELTRAYDQSKANYDDLVKKRDQSAMASDMEQSQQGERFTVLDPPSLPTAPDFPDRLKFCFIGLGSGLVLGLMIASFFEFLDDRLYGEGQIKALLPMAVISEIPEIDTVEDQQRTRKTRILGWATTAVVFTVIVAGSLISLLYK